MCWQQLLLREWCSRRPQAYAGHGALSAVAQLQGTSAARCLSTNVSLSSLTSSLCRQARCDCSLCTVLADSLNHDCAWERLGWRHAPLTSLDMDLTEV